MNLQDEENWNCIILRDSLANIKDNGLIITITTDFVTKIDIFVGLESQSQSHSEFVSGLLDKLIQI